MSLGDQRNNGSGNKLYENTYYSRTRFKDVDNKLSLGFQFRSGMLIVDISKEKEGFEYESLANIFITSTKAKILEQQIETFKKDRESGKAIPTMGYGINSGMGEIVSILAIHTTENNGVGITIGKVDAGGNFTKKVDFTFNKQYNYGLKWNTIETMDVEKEYLDEIDFDQFCEVISDFARFSNGAIGYNVADITRYDTKAILNKMNPIFDKLGIERQSGNNNRYSGNNFFNNGNNRGDSSSDHKSYDDAMEDLPFGDEE